MKDIFDQLTEQARTSTSAQADDESENSSFEEKEDQGQTEAAITERRLKDAVQNLLSLGLLEESSKRHLYKTAVTYFGQLNNILEPLDFYAQVDEIRGLIFLRVLNQVEDPNNDEAWSHPLVRRQRLTLEQSLLVAILRQHFVNYEQEQGVGAEGALVAVDELIPHLQLYLGDSGSESKERSRMMTLLDQLKVHGLVSAPDQHDRITIRPIIAHWANPENLQALLHQISAQAESQEAD